MIVALETLAAPVPNAMATGPFGSSIGTSTFRAEGVPVLRGSNLSAEVGTRLIDDDLVFITPELADKFSRSAATNGDLVFTCWGTVNQVGLIDSRSKYQRYIVSNKQMKFTADRNKILPLFLYYWFSSPVGQAAILSSSIGSSVPGFNLGQLRKMRVPLPSMVEQRGITSVLGALDDKIELNRRMNETLEAMARAIFRDWFVDFGPTRARMEGRTPYLAPDIWSLFPDRLDDEGKPERWRAGKLGDVAQQVGQTVSPETLDPNTPYIGLEHMPRRSIALSDWGRAGNVTSGKMAFRKCDFLFGKLRPYFHKIGIAPLDGICSTDIVVLNARERSAAAFILVCISQDEFVAFTDRTSDGTKMPRTSWSRMERYGVCLPDAAALEAFNALANPMLDRVVANIHESRTLAATRDLLLPKLMSGEVRVSEASAAVEHRLAEAG